MVDFDDVATLVAHETGAARSSLRPETRLLHDLGVYGDDVDELLQALSERFGVDFSEFRFDRYFYGEPHLLDWSGLFWTFRGPAKSPKAPLTLSMLMAAIDRGRWATTDSPAA